MLRIIVRIDSAAVAVHVGGSVQTYYRTFDVDLPKLEEELRRGGRNEDGTFEYATAIGIEVVQEGADEIERLRRALAYYADPRNYTEGDVPGHIYALNDSGGQARKVLGLPERVDEPDLWSVGRKCSEIAFGEEP